MVSSCLTMRRERSLRGFEAEALKALWMSSVEKESLRGSWTELAGRGMVSAISFLYGE